MDINAASKIISSKLENSDKVFFNRKNIELKEKLAELEVLIIEVNEIELRKIPILDEIKAIRDSIVHRCTHPKEYLVQEAENIFICSFCDIKLNIIVD